MNFLITSYILPLAEPVTLSPRLSFFLDNPRTEQEISLLEEYLVEAYDSGDDFRFPVHSDEPIVTLEGILFRFYESFKSNEYVSRYFGDYKRGKVFKFIAGMWVIARFEDEGETQRLYDHHRQMLEEGEAVVTILGEGHPIITNSTVTIP